MPGYKTHVVVGAGVYGLALYGLQHGMHLQPTVLTACEWGLFAIFGSLFPDVDTKSKGQKLFYLLLAVIFAIMLLRGQMAMVGVLSFMALLPMVVPHRGIFHRWWFITAFAGAMVIWCASATTIACRVLLFDASFFILGAMSHLWLDLGCRRMFKN
jgi:hypothetical protein